MNISEAIQARTEQKPFITRKKWRSEFNTWQAADIKIQPTDAPDCCIDKVQCAEVITKNAVRLTLRGHEPTILILRQNGRVDQIPEAALFEEAV